MTTLRWRILLGLLTIFAVGAIAVACGDDDDDDDGGSNGGAPSGTVRIQALQFESWDPHYANFAQDIAHFYMVWRGLYEFDNESKPIPSMAAGEPEVSDDGKVYTVKLKDGLKWSDGQPLTAQDFVAGIQRTCNPDNAGHYQYILTAIVGCDAYYAAGEESDAKKTELLNALGVRAVDDTTVEYTLANAQITFPILLAMWPTFPVPSHKVSSPNAAWPGPLENVYNGPFMPSAYTEKGQMDLVPNPNWAGSQKPKLEQIVLRYIDDPAVANNAYRSGELDAVQANASELDALKTEFKFEQDGAELHMYPATRTIGMEFNLKNEALSKPEVRLALSRATDRVTMMKVVFQDGNVATTHWVPPARNGLEAGEYDELLGYDVDAAKKLLADAGYANGAGFPSLTLLLTDTATNKALGEFIQAEWKKHLNIQIELELVDAPTRSARFNSSDFELFVGGWQEDYPDPENWFLGLWQTGGTLNKTFTSLPALDEAVDKAQFNSNDEERRELYREAESILLAEASGIAPLWHTQAKFLVKPHIKGMLENKRPGDTFVPGDWSPEYWETTAK